MNIDSIIKELRETKWEEKGEWEIISFRALVAGLKEAPGALVPGGSIIVKKVLKDILREQLIGKAGHAKDELAERMFNHYLDGRGITFTLSVSDMRMMAAGKKGVGPVDIRKKAWSKPDINPEWTNQLNSAITSGNPAPYKGSVLWGFDNGAIANYTVNYDGAITASASEGKWEGYVDFFDRFDLDPRWGWSESNPQGRSRRGERRTRIGYILNLGDDYDVKSQQAKAVQLVKSQVVTLDGTVKPNSGEGGLDLSS